MILTLHVPGATPEDRERAVKAAHDVLGASGFTPAEAANGYRACEEWKACASSSPRPTEEALDAAASFRLAELAAIEACCGEHAAPPVGSTLRALDT